MSPGESDTSLQKIVAKGNGREALKAYRQKRPVRKLVILDLRASRQNRNKPSKELQVFNPAAIVSISKVIKDDEKPSEK